jgi:hypothetical protein
VQFLYLFIGTPIVDFNGIDAKFLDASDQKRINGLTSQEKSIFVSKVVEACQYLRNRATRDEIYNGTVHCVWNIQFRCLYAYWFAKSPKLENGCQIWNGPKNRKKAVKEYPVVAFKMTIENL